MEILFVDDDKLRHEGFSRLVDRCECKHRSAHAFDVSTALCKMRHTKFDVVFLDHDLHDFQPAYGYGEGGELTGMDVVRGMIRLTPERLPSLAVVHSNNPVGADNMMSLLKQYNILLLDGCSMRQVRTFRFL